MFGSKIIQPKQANMIQGGGPAGGGGGMQGQMLKQMAGMGMKTALAGSPLAPLSGVIGGLFNDGGKVPETNRFGRKVTKPARTKTSSQGGGWWGKLLGRNMGGMTPHPMMGGPLSANPNGYNEGGSVGETPIKKVMDEQKLEQQAVAFERDQQRKQQAHDMAMQQKQQAFSEGQKMKKASQTTNMTPTKPKGPLSK